MYIEKVTIKAIKGFNHMEFDFSLDRTQDSEANQYAGWHVITGGNGQGKTSLLRAIVACLVGNDVAKSLSSFKGWVHKNKVAGSITLDIRRIEGDDYYFRKGKTGYASLSLPMEITIVRNEDGKPVYHVEPLLKYGSKNSKASRGVWAPGHQGWFSCAYGSFRRLFGLSDESKRLMNQPETAPYATMFEEAATLLDAASWIKTLKMQAYLEDNQLSKRIYDGVIQLLKQQFLPFSISFDDVTSEGLILKDDNNVKLDWKMMSDGYRSSLALLLDIVRHMTNAYGDACFAYDDSNNIYITRSGVILIDEVDAHLHPSWQREIGAWFKKHFPNVQFIVATHSPLICQAADKIYVLQDKAGDPRALNHDEIERIINASPTEILLSEVFGMTDTISDQAIANRKRYDELKRKKRAYETGQVDSFSRDEQNALDLLKNIVIF